jgi:hypothetical protein
MTDPPEKKEGGLARARSTVTPKPPSNEQCQSPVLVETAMMRWWRRQRNVRKTTGR